MFHIAVDFHMSLSKIYILSLHKLPTLFPALFHITNLLAPLVPSTPFIHTCILSPLFETYPSPWVLTNNFTSMVNPISAHISTDSNPASIYKREHVTLLA